ncbi:hypothetical protein RHSIM_Rhsim01G0140400 [Rhododendron simsii]|uniref:Transposase-associated domain-containing protein n=1 Tax=Rhododendron simsii TaxID=118357 RepID=A0A834LVF6_RHOSS|nr:hypothetical protein RHSIM_Rhsim01G0140400 [Rhododendron simsii]
MANLGPQPKIRCPCIDCLNSTKLSSVVVKIHLIRKGIDSSYKTWVHHGESVPAPQAHDDDHHDPNEGIGDETGGEVSEDGKQLHSMSEQIFVGGLLYNDIDELPVNHGKTMLHVKVYKKLTNDAFNIIMHSIKGMRPDYDEAIPWNIYEAKKFLRDLGLGYVPIHACINGCTLFWKENENMKNCQKCNEPRYKVNDGIGKKIPRKILWYLPLTQDYKGYIIEWKHFDELFPYFAVELRNVRLEMATNGFNPFGHMSQSYSMCLVIMVPYNLPPWKCMKEPFCFTSLLIPGPSSIEKDIYLRPLIDVYLHSLVDELKELWTNSVQTYDVFTR